METIIHGTPIIPGEARGELLYSSEPISFWGGYDQSSGEIIDRRHPLSGQCAAGKILCVPFSRGSSTTTAVLLESIRAGTAPAAIITTGRDSFFALASIVADEIYDVTLPIVMIDPEDVHGLEQAVWLELDEGGRIQTRS